MAKKEKVNYAELSKEELEARLADSREKVFQLRFQNATAPLKNPHVITAVRRDAARCLTFLKQIEKKSATKVSK